MSEVAEGLDQKHQEVESVSQARLTVVLREFVEMIADRGEVMLGVMVIAAVATLPCWECR